MNFFSSMRGPVYAAVMAAVLVLPAAAQTGIMKTEWEISKLQEGKKRSPFSPVEVLKADPGVKFTDRLRTVVTLRNSGPKNAEGLVLRYSLRLLLVKKGLSSRSGEEPREKAFWGVPFRVDEVRVTEVKALSERSARVIILGIAEQLSKLKNSGFVPVSLKMEIMLSPRPGDDPAAIMRESVLEILAP